jgi:hypothetical protein
MAARGRMPTAEMRSSSGGAFFEERIFGSMLRLLNRDVESIPSVLHQPEIDDQKSGENPC